MSKSDESVSDPAATPTTQTSAPDSPAGSSYPNYVLGVLFLVYILNFVDRQVISILLEDIKLELGVSDTAMGFLTGIAFALFYTVAGIPIARWADVGVRRSIIAGGIAIWSVMTAASGLAQSFTQLALARVGVGVGEAACSPPAHSLLADYFPAEKRATALSIYNSGINFGVLFGLVAGGWINEYFGWRAAFFVVGLPGVVLALVVRLTIREPRRGASEGVVHDEKPDPPVEVFRFLWKLRSFRHLALASGLHAFSSYGFTNWGPTFLRRVHDVGSAEAGTYLGLIIGFGGATGAILGGVLADRLSRRDVRWYLWIPAISSALSVPFVFGFLLFDSLPLALASYIPAVLFNAMWLAAIIATTQSLVRLRMRAVASAILLLVLNLIGMGLGPQAVGIMNDLLSEAYGDDAIRYSLLLAKMMTVWSIIHFLLACAHTSRRSRGKKQLEPAVTRLARSRVNLMPELPKDWNQRYVDGDTPWDFGHPSGELIKLLQQFTPPTSGKVLEVGCGTGSNAVYLAQQGYNVTAVDVAPLAIERASRRAEDAGVKVKFFVADLLDPPAELLSSAAEQRFSLLYDRGVYHIMRSVGLFGFLKTLEQMGAPGSLYFVLAGNANDPDTESHGPPRVHDYELCHEMAPLFELVQLREFFFEGVVDDQLIAPMGWSAVLRRRSN